MAYKGSSVESDALASALKSSYRSKMVTFTLVGLVVGALLGFIVGRATTVDAPAVSVVSSESTPGGDGFDVEGGWSEQGAAGQSLLSDENAALPVGVNASTSVEPMSAYGWNYVDFDAARPTVTLWEDFQCPACAGFERSPVKAAIVAKADAGEINLIFRPLSFLDLTLKNDSSARATAAWGCAIDAGVGAKYRELVFANQPSQEGTGFTDEELVSGGELAGLTGDAFTSFSDCFAAGTYAAWSGTSSFFSPQEVGGTPTIMVEGVVLPPADSGSVESVEAAIAAVK
jgi:protein-disulfide isomerase